MHRDGHPVIERQIGGQAVHLVAEHERGRDGEVDRLGEESAAIVAQVKEVTVHPDADKLFVIKVDTGTDIRQVVAGIRRSYSPEQLVGKRVVLVANLEPAVIRGVESQGMLLAAGDPPRVLFVDDGVAPGTRVK